LQTLGYKINSLFHVNHTSGSGTPQGTSDLSAKFQKYLVEHCRISWRIRLLYGGGTFGSLGVLGAAPTTSALNSAVMYPLPTGATQATSVQGAAVQKYASKRFDWPRDRPYLTAVYEPEQLNPAFIWKGSHSVDVFKLDGAPLIDLTEYQAVFGADPTNLQYWIFNFQDVLADATYEGVWLAVIDLSYRVKAFDRVVLSDSLRSGPLNVVRCDAEVRQPQDSPLSSFVTIQDSKEKEEKVEVKTPRDSVPRKEIQSSSSLHPTVLRRMLIRA